MAWLAAMLAILAATLAIGWVINRADRKHANLLSVQQKRTLNYLTEQMRDNHVSGD